MKIRTAALAVALFATTASTFAFAQGFSDKDKTFLKESTEDHYAEIKMAQMTLRTTKNPTLKAFAQKMITDHKALIAGTKPVALKAGVTLPTTPSVKADAEYLKLKVLTGDTYDKSYVDTADSDHHEDLTKVKQENTETSNADMKKLTAHAGDVIAKHTEMIDALKAKMGA
ncbi:MAG: DUF4142 domain-containing protein [Janthinobacterium lividum]